MFRTIRCGILDEQQGTWIQLLSGVGMESALKDGCGDVEEHLWSEIARSWARGYNFHQVWGESLVRDSLQLGDCSRGLSVKVDFKIIKLKQIKKTNFTQYMDK